MAVAHVPTRLATPGGPGLTGGSGPGCCSNCQGPADPCTTTLASHPCEPNNITQGSLEYMGSNYQGRPKGMGALVVSCAGEEKRLR